MFIPKVLLKRLYTFSSLTNTPQGLSFSIKNRLSDCEFIALHGLKITGNTIDLSQVFIEVDGELKNAQHISSTNAIDFPLRKVLTIYILDMALPTGKYEIDIACEAKPFGKISFSVEDTITDNPSPNVKIPRDNNDDYSTNAIEQRQRFLEEYTQTKPNHIYQFSFDPQKTKGNIEHLTGVAQVPIGLAGPITINGEHAQGDFLIPLATTEGTLVASYNRGIKLLNLCGGPKCTVMRDAMQRAPV
ncbi:MAG TPA: hypothetical protein PK230_11315, partial [Chitinophagales bacterium]|nr:hypothetical protein [Chitinophagales bacterium]